MRAGEERSRAKERIFSFRDDFGQWDPRAQRPELWNLYNGKIRKGEQVRVFPISNWTELDVWQYVAREQLELPSIYYAHEREVFDRDGMLYATSDVIERDETRVPSPNGCGSALSATRAVQAGPLACASRRCGVGGDWAATRVTERGDTRRRRSRLRGLRWRTGSVSDISRGTAPTAIAVGDSERSAPRHLRLGRRRPSRRWIGRLLSLRHEAVFVEQMEAVEETSERARRRVPSHLRCSPTGCARSASRGSRATSPIVVS